MKTKEMIEFFKTRDVMPEQGCQCLIEDFHACESTPESVTANDPQHLARLLIYQIKEVLFPVISELRQELKQVEHAGQLFKDELDARDLQQEEEMDKVIHDRAAYAAHEANRVLCLALGDNSQPKWADAPEWQKVSAIKGVQMIAANPLTTPEQSHEGWLTEKTATGWKYGPVKNPEAKEHPCFVPYSELPENQRLKDEMFGLVVRAVLGL